MALEEKRRPKSKVLAQRDLVADAEIASFLSTLKGLKNEDFPLQADFSRMEPMLSAPEKEKLRLCKLLYCMDFKKEMFLHFGVLLEIRLTSIIDLYRTNGWRTPVGYVNLTARDNSFENFLSKKTLNDKAAAIASWNLFNNQDASERIKSKLQAFRILRNHGGHGKPLDQYISSLLLSRQDCDQEVLEVFTILSEIGKATDYLIANHPPLI